MELKRFVPGVNLLCSIGYGYVPSIALDGYRPETFLMQYKRCLSYYAKKDMGRFMIASMPIYSSSWQRSIEFLESVGFEPIAKPGVNPNSHNEIVIFAKTFTDEELANIASGIAIMFEQYSGCMCVDCKLYRDTGKSRMRLVYSSVSCGLTLIHIPNEDFDIEQYKTIYRQYNYGIGRFIMASIPTNWSKANEFLKTAGFEEALKGVEPNSGQEIIVLIKTLSDEELLKLTNRY